MRYVCMLCVVLLLVGCGTMNVQAWALKSSGGLATVVILDRTSIGNLAPTKTKIAGFARELLAFLDSGNVADLTQGALQAEVLRIVPPAYNDFALRVLAVVESRHLEVDRIGDANVDRLRAFLKGILDIAVDYMDRYHPGTP